MPETKVTNMCDTALSNLYCWFQAGRGDTPTSSDITSVLNSKNSPPYSFHSQFPTALLHKSRGTLKARLAWRAHCHQVPSLSVSLTFS